MGHGISWDPKDYHVGQRVHWGPDLYDKAEYPELDMYDWLGLPKTWNGNIKSIEKKPNRIGSPLTITLILDKFPNKEFIITGVPTLSKQL